MDINKLVRMNEDLIESFNLKAYQDAKNYAVIGALAALEITNEVQKYYVTHLDEKKEIDALLMNLYGMLQSLFVSVDALYAMSYELVGSKKFINLNQNEDMRELKHIRNDVVGHPANRSLRGEGNSYCILEKEGLNSYHFSYMICNNAGCSKREVDLIRLVSAYYEEANAVLNNLLVVSKTGIQNEFLENLAEKVLTLYPNKAYIDELNLLYQKYITKYPDANKKQHRFVWRYELVNKINDFRFAKITKLGLELKTDILFLEIEKIYTIITGKPNYNKKLHKNGTLLKSMYRFVRKNPDLYAIRENLYDFGHPHFYDTFMKFKKKAKNNPTVREYLGYIEELIKLEESDLIYAYMVPLKKYEIK